MMITAIDHLPKNRDWVASQVPELILLSHYLGIELKEGNTYCSPFRDDKNPGCTVYTKPNGQVIFKDWATGETYDFISVIVRKYGLSFKEAWMKVLADLNYIKELYKVMDTPKQSRKRKSLKAIKKPWDESSLAYWRQYYITEDILNMYKVHNVDLVYIDGALRFRATENNPIFAYQFDDTHLRVYRPLASYKQTKWRSNASESHFHGLDSISPSQLLIITSSGKDAMVLKVLGYEAIAPQTEAISGRNTVLKTLKKDFKFLVFFMDSDETGLAANSKLSSAYGGVSISIPLKYHCKDISDFIAKFGKKKAAKLVKKRLSKALRIHSLPFV